VKTLELFAYGTFRDYSSDPGSYLELNSNQLNKLKQLTLVSFGSSRNVKKIQFEFLTALFRSSLNIPCSRRLWISPIPGTWSHSSSMPFIMSTDLPDSPRHIKVLSSLSLLSLSASLSVCLCLSLSVGLCRSGSHQREVGSEESSLPCEKLLEPQCPPRGDPRAHRSTPSLVSDC
jgi:hypothetical protein